MKRYIAALLALMLLALGAGYAESTMKDLRNMRKNAGDRIPEMEPVPMREAEATPEPELVEIDESAYEPLASGAKGEDVKAMQQRLIDLGYLKGKADGSYGGGTAAAVKAFQQAAELEPTGEADARTLATLYAMQMPEKAQYEKLDYKRASGMSFSYRNTPVEFKGKVLQVLENDEYADTLGVYTALRVTTRGDNDDIVYVAYFRAADAEPVSEGDSVTVRGVARKVYRYISEAGDSITLPRIEADGVEVAGR